MLQICQLSIPSIYPQDIGLNKPCILVVECGHSVQDIPTRYETTLFHFLRQAMDLPRLLLLNFSGLAAFPSGECTESLPVVGSQEDASESPPSRSTLHWSSYIRSDGRLNCFLEREHHSLSVWFKATIYPSSEKANCLILMP